MFLKVLVVGSSIIIAIIVWMLLALSAAIQMPDNRSIEEIKEGLNKLDEGEDV